MKVKYNLIVAIFLMVTLLVPVRYVRAEEMTLEQKVAEVLACGFSGQSAEAAINNLQYCNNTILMGSNVQGMSVEQIRAMTDQIHAASPDSWVMTDEEGGQVQRIDMGYPSPRQMGNDGTVGQYGQEIGQLLNAAGIDINLAPVADIEDGEGVIGDRSFGASPAVVSVNVVDFLTAMQEQGVLGVVKHLPGHGRIEDSADTHDNVGVLPYGWGEITEYDLVPFMAAFNNGARMAMLGHIAVPAMAGSTPASQSKIIIDEIRRTIPGGESVVLMSDEISMGGAGGDPFEATVRALAAGADMVLYVGTNPQYLHETVVSAYESGALSMEDLDRKVERIQALKDSTTTVEQPDTAAASATAPLVQGENLDGEVEGVVAELSDASSTSTEGMSWWMRTLVLIVEGSKSLDKILELLDKTGLIKKDDALNVIYWLGGIILASVSMIFYFLLREVVGERKSKGNWTKRYFWSTIIIGIAAAAADSPFIWRAAKVVGLVWLGLWTIGGLYKSWRHMGGRRIPNWAWTATLLPPLLYVIVYLGTYATMMTINLLPVFAVEGETTAVQQATETPSSDSSESVTGEAEFDEPVAWTGAPLADIPDGYVIPWVWEQVRLGVADEGGTDAEALWIYTNQRTEYAGPANRCTEADHSGCTSSVGAAGWNQFMPGTWETYADPDWSPYDLRQSSRAAYRMFKDLKLFEQPTRLAFQDRYSGQDGGMVWNAGSPGSAVYDGWDQAGIVWDNYQAILRAGSTSASKTADDNTLVPEIKMGVAGLSSRLTEICQDEVEPCGFALPGGPDGYIQGTADNGWKGWHENAWDWWRPGHQSSDVDPVDVLSMLNGRVTAIGRFNNGGNGGGTTYLIVSNGRWTQTVYHCDRDYVAQGDEVKWGEPLCLMGNQGTSDWTHLHLSIQGPDGYVQDQTQWWP